MSNPGGAAGAECADSARLCDHKNCGKLLHKPLLCSAPSASAPPTAARSARCPQCLAQQGCRCRERGSPPQEGSATGMSQVGGYALGPLWYKVNRDRRATLEREGERGREGGREEDFIRNQCHYGLPTSRGHMVSLV